MPPRHRFLICPDAELLHAQAQAACGQAARKVYWADDDPPFPEAFWQDLTVKSLFSEPKALVIRRADTLKAADWDKLAGAVPAAPSDITVLLCLESEWKKNKPPVPAWLAKRDIYAEADKSGRVWASPGLTERDMDGFLADWAAREGLTFAPGAREAMGRALPLDARKARLELDKIALAANGGQVTAEHAELLQATGEMDFFAFMDALANGRAADQVWKRVLDNHRESENMVFNLVGYLTWEARTLWMLTHGEENAARIPPFVRNKKAALAKRLGPARIAGLIDLCMEAELGIKTGARTPDQALDLLVAGLTGLFSPSGAPGR